MMAFSADSLYNFWKQDTGNKMLVNDLLQLLAQQASCERALEFIRELPPAIANESWVNAYRLQFLIQAGRASEVITFITSTIDSQHPLSDMELYLGMVAAHLHSDHVLVLNFYTHISDTPLEALLLAARTHYLCGEKDIAASLIDQSAFVKEAAALGLRAMIALDNGEEALAMTLADEALSLQPKQFDALVVRASMANYQQRYDESAYWVDQALQIMPEQGRLLSLKGQYLMQLGELNGALPVLLQATQNMPEHTGTVLLVGWCYLMLGQYQEARDYFERACEQDRSFADSHGSLAAALFYCGDISGSKRAAAVAKRLNPQSFTVAFIEALLLEQAGEKELAAAKIQQVYASPHYSGTGTNWDVIQKALMDRTPPHAS